MSGRLSQLKKPIYTKKKKVIFASGAGSNAKKIIEILGDKKICISFLIVCNKPAEVLLI